MSVHKGYSDVFAALINEANRESTSPWFVDLSRANSYHFIKILEYILDDKIDDIVRNTLLSKEENCSNYKHMLQHLTQSNETLYRTGINKELLAKRDTRALNGLVLTLAELHEKYKGGKETRCIPHVSFKDNDENETINVNEEKHEDADGGEFSGPNQCSVDLSDHPEYASKQDPQEFVGRKFVQFLMEEHPSLLSDRSSGLQDDCGEIENIESDDFSYEEFHSALTSSTYDEDLYQEKHPGSRRRLPHAIQTTPIAAPGQVKNVNDSAQLHNGLIVEGIPRTSGYKKDELTTLLHSLFSKFEQLKGDSIIIPTEENGSTKGYAIVDFRSSISAQQAKSSLNEIMIDPAHQIRIYDIDEYLGGESLSEYSKQLLESVKVAGNGSTSQEFVQGHSYFNTNHSFDNMQEKENRRDSQVSDYFYSMDNISVSSDDLLEDSLRSLELDEETQSEMDSEMDSERARRELNELKERERAAERERVAKKHRAAVLVARKKERKTSPTRSAIRSNTALVTKSPAPKKRLGRKKAPPVPAARSKSKKATTKKQKSTPSPNRNDSKHVAALRRRTEEENEQYRLKREKKYLLSQEYTVTDLMKQLDSFKKKYKERWRKVARERKYEDEVVKKKELEEIKGILDSSFSDIVGRSKLAELEARCDTESERRELRNKMIKIRNDLKNDIKQLRAKLDREDDMRLERSVMPRRRDLFSYSNN